MTDNFEKAMAKVFELEGGISNDVHDRGGLTKYGISQNSYPALDIKQLTVEEAKKIYRRDYWEKCKCHLIGSEMIASQVFDIAVNCGAPTAPKMLQRAINSFLPRGSKLKEDGIIGKQTLATLAAIDETKLNKTLAKHRVMYYSNICKNDLEQYRFLQGWINRVFEYL